MISIASKYYKNNKAKYYFHIISQDKKPNKKVEV